jgi:phage terminase large subunit
MGTYYTEALNNLKNKGRLVNETLYEPDQKVHVAADVGLRDSTAWWFWQPRADGIAIIDHHEASGKHVEYYLEMLYNKGYDYHQIWLPHDAKAKTLATRRSTVEQFATPSISRPDLYPEGSRLPIRITPKLSIQSGIDAVRLILPSCYFDYKKTEIGIDALRSYQRQYHEHSQAFSDTPLHNWASNSADAFRYLALVAGKSVAIQTETPTLTALPDAARLGLQNRGPLSGYCLDDLWRQRENDRKNLRPLRI